MLPLPTLPTLSTPLPPLQPLSLVPPRTCTRSQAHAHTGPQARTGENRKSCFSKNVFFRVFRKTRFSIFATLAWLPPSPPSPPPLPRASTHSPPPLRTCAHPGKRTCRHAHSPKPTKTKNRVFRKSTIFENRRFSILVDFGRFWSIAGSPFV